MNTRSTTRASRRPTGRDGAVCPHSSVTCANLSAIRDRRAAEIRWGRCVDVRPRTARVVSLPPSALAMCAGECTGDRGQADDRHDRTRVATHQRQFAGQASGRLSSRLSNCTTSRLGAGTTSRRADMPIAEGELDADLARSGPPHIRRPARVLHRRAARRARRPGVRRRRSARHPARGRDSRPSPRSNSAASSC